MRKLLYIWIVLFGFSASIHAQFDPFQYIVLVNPAADPASITAVRSSLNSTRVSGAGCSQFGIEVWEVAGYPYTDNGVSITDIDGTIGNASGKTVIDGVGFSFDTDIIRGIPEDISCASGLSSLPVNGCETVIIAYCDTGIAKYNNLSSIQVPLPITTYGGYDYVNMDADPSDDNGHGTHITSASIMAMNQSSNCITNNFEYLFYKTQAADGTGSLSDLITAICEAHTQKADIINLSLSYPGSVYQTEFDALSYIIDRVTEAGTAVIAAAGNDSYDNDQPIAYLPASLPHDQISVGSLDCNDNLSTFSNFGDRVHVATRGEGIRGYNIDYSTMVSQSGTSQATAIATAMSALILSKPSINPTPANLKCALVTSSTPVQSLNDLVLSDGKINPVEALMALGNGTCTLPCITDLDLGANTIPTDLYKAAETLHSENLILDDKLIRYEAGSFINLGLEFEVEQGATFLASITPCQ